MSTAPDLAARDGLTSFERAVRQPRMLGLFLPHQSGAWTPSTAPRETTWTFAYNARLTVRAEEKGREVRVLVNAHVICRPTLAEARDWRSEILARVDDAVLDSFYGSFAGGDQASWNAHGRLDWAVGGNIHLVGTPDMIVDWFVRLRAAGVDGVQINFYDFGPDLERFARTVLPLMHEAGLRNPEPAGPDTGSQA